MTEELRMDVLRSYVWEEDTHFHDGRCYLGGLGQRTQRKADKREPAVGHESRESSTAVLYEEDVMGRLAHEYSHMGWEALARVSNHVESQMGRFVNAGANRYVVQ